MISAHTARAFVVHAGYMDKDPFGAATLWVFGNQALLMTRHEDVKQVHIDAKRFLAL